MRKFLRILMMLFLVAYTTAGWGKYVKIQGKEFPDNGVGRFPTDANTTRDGIYLTTDNGTMRKISVSSGDALAITKNSTFTITSTAGKISYIAFSFDNGRIGTSNHSSEKWSKKSSGNWSHKDNRVGIPRKSYWSTDSDNPTGVQSVSFYGNGEDEVHILWIYIFYGDATSDSAPSVTITPTEFSGDYADVSVSASGASAIYWTTNGNEPSTTNTNSGTSKRIYNSCWVKAFSAKTQSLNVDKEVEQTGNTTIYSATTSKFCEQYWNVSTANGLHSDNKYYATFCHKNIMKVPANCTAYTYKKDGNKMKPNQSIGAGQYLPGSTSGTPVIICSGTTAQSTLRFTNPNGNYVSNTADVSGNAKEFKGNGTGGYVTVSGNNYYLMKDPIYGGLNFLKYSGQCPPHTCYVQLSSSSAKSFVFEFPDDDGGTTGISVVTTGNQAYDENAPMYNTAGQRVGASYKGIVIQNGRKFIKR